MPSLHLPTVSLVCAALLSLVTPPDVKAQSGPWDALLANSQWYVPAENLLAYITPSTNFSDPQALADQTVWSITTAESGVFSGTSVNEFKLGPEISTGSSAMSGIVTQSGQVRIVFTDDANQTTTIGVGQMREVGGTPYVEMQMITGSGSAYVTHWAYMALYNGDTILPGLAIDDDLRWDEWSWMKETSWTLSSAEGLKSFEIADYRNGYFWGSGISLGGDEEAFTFIGSATPEGNILFAFVQDGVLTSLIGQITGNGSNGAMVLRGYDGVNVGDDAAYATVIPEPSTGLALLGGAALLFGLSKRKRLRLRGKC